MTEQNNEEVMAETIETEATPNNHITTKLTNKQRKNLKRNQQAYKKQMEDYIEFSKTKQAQEAKKFQILKERVGRNIYKNLKKASTVTIPEKKNEETGAVLEAERTVLDKDKFLRELNFAVIVLREDRILKGVRKRSTGRSSDRREHAAVIRHIKARAEAIISTGEEIINLTPEVADESK